MTKLGKRECEELLDTYLAEDQAHAITRIEAALQEDDELRKEFGGLVEMCRDLEEIGRQRRAAAPPADLVGAVMAAVDGTRRTQAHKRSALRRLAWAAAAIAAVLLLSWFVFLRERTDSPDSAPRLAKPREPVAPTPESVEDAGSESVPAVRTARQMLAEAMKHLDEQTRARPSQQDQAVDERTGPRDFTDLTLQDVLEERQRAVADDRARGRLVRWASLRWDEARELATGPGISLDARIGSSRYLQGPMGEYVLTAAVTERPGDPYVRYGLADRLSEKAGAGTEAIAQYEQAAALDSGNSLPYYEIARERLEQNDVAAALEALSTAAGIDTAYAYSGEASRYQAEALVARGMDSAAAQLLAAVVAGTEEYLELTDLASELLDYGAELDQSGDAETALQVYDAVSRLGMQLVAGAAFSRERLAGIDMQRMALDVLEQLYPRLGLDPETLIPQTEDLVDNILYLRDFYNQLDVLFTEGPVEDAAFWASVANTIIESGDLALVESLGSGP